MDRGLRDANEIVYGAALLVHQFRRRRPLKAATFIGRWLRSEARRGGNHAHTGRHQAVQHTVDALILNILRHHGYASEAHNLRTRKSR
jgi:hypothetical protein